MKDTSTPSLALPVGTRDHIQGSASAVVTRVVYGDYQCPFAGALHPVVKKLQRAFGDRLRFVFRHFPLITKHPDAQRAAEAAEAAGGQGKFWEMHDYVFERQWFLDAGSLAHAAEMLGLDTDRFAREVSERTYAKRVQEDLESGRASGVNGTPTVFINGVRGEEEDEDDFETLQAKIEAAIARAKANKGPG